MLCVIGAYALKNNMSQVIACLVFGAIGFSFMGISQMPDVDFPVLTVSVSWAGADPETMETSVADVIAFQKANPRKMTFASAGAGSSTNTAASA